MDLLYCAEKGIKDFQSKRYRQFFILFSKIIRVEDSFIDLRISGINNMIRSLK
jgi:hypothetical protein